MATHHAATGSLIGGQATISVGPESVGLLSRARSLHVGTVALASGPPDQVAACQFLASWSLELALKSYLAHVRVPKMQIQPIRHNLSALWEKAAAMGLPISGTPPRWCALLSSLHDKPYHSRYPTEAAASIRPSLALLSSELRAVIDAVISAVQPS